MRRRGINVSQSYIHCFLVLSDRMLYYMYNTTTRLTLIHLLLMVMGMYNPGRKYPSP
jgi:hypothetical protein